MGKWVTPSPSTLLIRSGQRNPRILLSPNTHALAESRTHFCPAAAAPEQGKRVLHPSNTPSPILSGTCKKRPSSCPIRQFESGFVFLLVEKI